jgi:hypothetical protein
MTTNTDDMTPEESDALISSAAEESRRLLAWIKKSREGQPARLAKARADADEARGWSLIEEPWESQITAVPAYNGDGQRTGDALTLPNITAKELWGARLAFDMLDCGDDFDRIEEVQTRYFTMTGGDTGLLFLLAMSALSTLASVVVPQMVEELEDRASNYDVRPMLAEARKKAWDGRVSELRDPSGSAGAE